LVLDAKRGVRHLSIYLSSVELWTFMYMEQWLVITLNLYVCKTMRAWYYGCVLVVICSVFTL
jgi:hypothetical protein